MRFFLLPQSILRMGLVLGVMLGLASPLLTMAQDTAATPEVQEFAAAPAPGALNISVIGSDGIALSGSFAVTDAAGAYQEVWASGGQATAMNVAAGSASVSQITGTTDYAPDYAAKYVEVPAGGTASLAFTNVFLDADGDAIGDSLDVCSAGHDGVDSDVDGTADACDPTPYGDPTPIPTAIPTSEPTVAPTAVPTVEPTVVPTSEPTVAPTAIPTVVLTPEPTPVETSQPTAVPAVLPTIAPTEGPVLESTPEPAPEEPVGASEEETVALSVEIAAEPVVVDAAPVSCQDAQAVSPWIASDLADYPPGGLVTLSSGSWVPGQVVEILVEDDGIADAEMGEWSYTVTVTADASGAFTHSFNIAPWFVADYSVVAAGECAEARTTFTDSVAVVPGGIVTGCSQSPAGDLVAAGSTVTVICNVSLPTSGRQDVLGTRPSLTTPGFTAAVDFNAFGASYPIPQGTVAANGWGRSAGPGSTVVITVMVLTTAQPGSVFNASFGVCQLAPSMTTNDTSPPKTDATCGNQSSSSVGISLTVALMEDSHFTVTCTPAVLGPQTAFNTTAFSTCTVTALSAMGTSNLRIDQILSSRNAVNAWTTDLATTGGTSLASIPGTYPASGSITTIAAGASYSFRVRFTPTSCPAALVNPSVGIGVKVTVMRSGSAGQSVTSGTRTITSSFRSADTASSALLTATPATVNKTYDMNVAQTGTASFALNFTVSGCGQQKVSASMSAFSRVGGPVGTVPTLASANETTPSNPSGMVLIVADISTLSNNSAAPTLLLTGSTNGSSATVSQTIDLVYSIPANTPVGTYQSTITVTTGDAP